MGLERKQEPTSEAEKRTTDLCSSWDHRRAQPPTATVSRHEPHHSHDWIDYHDALARAILVHQNVIGQFPSKDAKRGDSVYIILEPWGQFFWNHPSWVGQTSCMKEKRAT